MDNTEISIKASGLADDTLTLNQTSTHWGADFVAKHVGNNGVGAVDEEIRLSQYLKYDLTIDLNLGEYHQYVRAFLYQTGIVLH